MSKLLVLLRYQCDDPIELPDFFVPSVKLRNILSEAKICKLQISLYRKRNQFQTNQTQRYNCAHNYHAW